MTDIEKINNLTIESAFGGILIPLNGDDLRETLTGLIIAIHKKACRNQDQKEENEKNVSQTYPLAAGIEPKGGP